LAILLGCIADDNTGATDLANTLVANGMRTIQIIGVPEADQPAPDAEAVVVALKSRTIPPRDAIDQSLETCKWLQRNGARQIFFKYCSTFDSTDKGNIGPVAEALLDVLGEDFSIACPAFPVNGRTIFKGYLFVGDVLLSESGMRNHPLTPMTDPSLVRVLDRQSKTAVGLVEHGDVDRGADAILSRFNALRSEGKRLAIVDAISDRHLREIGTACAGLGLVTGGSGVAMGLPENFRRQGLLPENIDATALPPASGKAAILAGSCSQATLGQIAQFTDASRPAFRIDSQALADGKDVAAEALDWAVDKLGDEPVLIYSSGTPEEVRAVQASHGREEAGAMIERTMAAIAKGLVDAGVRRLVVAGGETSGAVVEALGVKALRIGQEIDPGVPWTLSLGDPAIFLALKSGNFGGPDFFEKSFNTKEPG
jgi:uncharacterized protein YgbK (DUF1537 family)